MPVFDGAPKIIRRVKDPWTDQTEPPPAALSWGAIDANVGLAQTIGADVSLLKGDRWHQVQGGLTENYLGGVATTIVQNQTHTVGGDRTTTIAGNHTETVVGNLNSSIIGPTNALYLSPKNDVHVSPNNRVNSAPENQQEPSSKTHILGVAFEHKAAETVITDVSLGLNGLSNEFTAMKCEGTGLAVGSTVLVLDSVLGLAIEPKIAEVDLEPLHVLLKGAEAKVAAGTVAVSPSVNAVPHVPTAGGH